MFGGATTKAIEAVVDAVMRNLSENIVALYLYGSLSSGTYQSEQSDVNLLLIVDDEISLHEIRNVLRPVWCQQMQVLKRTPLIATRDALDRHFYFNPGLAIHLAQYGTLLSGEAWSSEPPTYDKVEHLAQMARIAMHASTAIAPSLLTDRKYTQLLSNLRTLTRQLFGIEVDKDEHAASLLGLLQADILRRLEQHPSLLWEDQRVPVGPPLVRDLRAIYEHNNKLVLLLPDLGPEYVAERIAHIDWEAVASRIVGQYQALWVTTAAQLRLILKYDYAAEYHLGTFNHAWGRDPAAELSVAPWRIFRNLGRQPSALLVDTLPQAYLSSEDSDLTMLVHDLHNRILNVQLQNELYCRINNWPVPKTPEAATDRDLPLEKRIDGIRDNLDWWASYYRSLVTDALAQVA